MLKKSLTICAAIIATLLWRNDPLHAEEQVPTVNVRTIFQALNCTISWQNPVIQLTRGADTMTLTVGSNRVTKNGIPLTLTNPIRLVNGTAVIATTDIYAVAENWRGLQNATNRIPVAGKTHTVGSGDSLWSIAQSYATDTDHLMMWNQLRDQVLFPGEKLYVEEPYVAHTVVAGNSLWTIAQQYSTTVSAIQTKNQLSSTMIYVGQLLKIPVPKEMWAQPSEVVAAPTNLAQGIFPFVNGTYQQFGDTWGQSRAFGGQRTHEGIDILANRGTPLFSVEDGTIVSYGWSELGGWRLSIKVNNSTVLYYAHLSGYAPSIVKGATVKKGQLIGYSGDTGYGPEGTSGKFVPHLHFGMYDSTSSPWKAFNGYSYLKWWELR